MLNAMPNDSHGLNTRLNSCLYPRLARTTSSFVLIELALDDILSRPMLYRWAGSGEGCRKAYPKIHYMQD